MEHLLLLLLLSLKLLDFVFVVILDVIVDFMGYGNYGL